MIEGVIFNTRNFSVHDGPGIRTTIFLKGCPLKCTWCHNPESQSKDIEQFSTTKSLGGKSFETNEIIGKHISVAQLLDEIKKDIPFFDESGGGVTLSGGEPLAQPEFTIELLRSCKSLGIHTALDTCGYAPWKVLEKTVSLTDLYLFDLKIIDNQKHIKHTGLSNGLILENLTKLADLAKPIHIRIPLVEGITDTTENLQAIKKIILELGCVQRIDLLPYHTLAKNKFKRFYVEYSLKDLGEYSKAKSQTILNDFKALAPMITVGG